MSCPPDERLSAHVDGALSHRDRERVVGHLVDCASCRERVGELRQVAARVRRAAPPSAPPADLAARLVDIAGAEASAPLRARPFDRGGRPTRRPMPSARRRVRRAGLAVGSGMATMALAAVAVGWAAAPPVRRAAVDPGPVALGEFTSALGSEPLADAATAAALTVTPQTTTTRVESPEPGSATSSEGAYARLQRAQEATDHVAHTGTRRVQVRHVTGYWTTDVGVTARPGSGVEVTLPGRAGTRTGFLPDQSSLGVDLVATNHTLLTGDGPVVAGRPTHVVEARDDESVAARWWLDRETGLVLWSEVRSRGVVVRSSGFIDITLGGGTGRHVAPRLTVPMPVTALTVTAAPQLARSGFACPTRLAGLDLVRMRQVGDVLHSVYGDGVATVSVFEQRGALAGAPRGTVWDPALRGYRSQGLPTMITWQSGDRVLTVVTSAGIEHAAAVSAELPHDAPVLRTRTDRVVDGWRVVLAEMGVR